MHKLGEGAWVSIAIAGVHQSGCNNARTPSSDLNCSMTTRIVPHVGKHHWILEVIIGFVGTVERE